MVVSRIDLRIDANSTHAERRQVHDSIAPTNAFLILGLAGTGECFLTHLFSISQFAIYTKNYFNLLANTSKSCDVLCFNEREQYLNVSYNNN